MKEQALLIQKVNDKVELNDLRLKWSPTISKDWLGGGLVTNHTEHAETVILGESPACCASVICPALFLRSPCSDPRVRSAPFPLFSRVILAPVFGCANPGPTTLSNPNHEIKMTDRAVQADDQGCSGHP